MSISEPCPMRAEDRRVLLSIVELLMQTGHDLCADRVLGLIYTEESDDDDLVEFDAFKARVRMA